MLGREILREANLQRWNGNHRKSPTGLCSSGPAPDGAIFVIRGGVFAVGLIGEDGVVCNRISAGTSNLSKEQATKTNTPFELAFLLVIYVEEIKLAAAIREILGDAYEQTAQDRCAKRIEEKEQTWAIREGKLNRIAAIDLRRRVYSAKCSPMTEIATGHAN